MQNVVATLLYWSVLILMVPALLLFAVWVLAAVRLRKPWQLMTALLTATTFGCCLWGIRSLHQDRQRHQHHPARSAALGRWVLAMGASAVLLKVLVPKRHRFAPVGPDRGPDEPAA